MKISINKTRLAEIIKEELSGYQEQNTTARSSGLANDAVAHLSQDPELVSWRRSVFALEGQRSRRDLLVDMFLKVAEYFELSSESMRLAAFDAQSRAQEIERTTEEPPEEEIEIEPEEETLEPEEGEL